MATTTSRRPAWLPLVPTALLAAACGASAASAPHAGEPAPVLAVETVRGVPTFTLDGEPLTIPCFETYAPRRRYFEQFARAGVWLHSFNTNATGGDYARSPAWSVRLHGKLWYHDNDVVSFLAPQVLGRVGISDGEREERSVRHHLTVLGYTPTVEQTRWMYRRSMGFALASGAYESYFDLHGGYYDHPELMAEVERLNRLAARSARWDRRSSAQVLVVADEASCSYASFRSELLGQALRDTQPRLIKIGAPADHILLGDPPASTSTATGSSSSSTATTCRRRSVRRSAPGSSEEAGTSSGATLPGASRVGPRPSTRCGS